MVICREKQQLRWATDEIGSIDETPFKLGTGHSEQPCFAPVAIKVCNSLWYSRCVRGRPPRPTHRVFCDVWSSVTWASLNRYTLSQTARPPGKEQWRQRPTTKDSPLGVFRSADRRGRRKEDVRRPMRFRFVTRRRLLQRIRS